jgi:isoquinoline 1-oxidoreductase beta subunit
MSASAMAEIDMEQIEVHVTFAGGSFGLHSSASATPAGRARSLEALEWKHPIKVSRCAGLQGGRYRCDGLAPRAAAADSDGRLTAFTSRSWPNRRRSTSRSCAT